MNLSAVLLKRDVMSEWTAQCLEYDIAAQGKTIQEAIKALYTLLSRYVNEREGGLEGIPPAPDFYRKDFRKGAPMEMQKITWRKKPKTPQFELLARAV